MFKPAPCRLYLEDGDMPRYIYDPAPSHLAHSLHVNGQRVRVGVPFDYDGDLSEDPKLRAHIERVPGKVVGGERLPCIVRVNDRDEAVRRAERTPAEVALRAALDKVAEAVGLAAGAAVEAVVAAVEARVAAVPLEGAIGEALASVRAASPVLDPDIRGPITPGDTLGPLGDGVRAIQPNPAASRTLAVDAPTLDTPSVVYAEADLMERTAADLDALCAANGVDLTSAQKRSKAGRVDALRAAGLVAEG